MSINIHADNKSIVKDGKFSYLVNNYPSHSSSIFLLNVEGFFADSYILIGNVGSENTEILQIKAVNTTTNEVTFSNFTEMAVGAGIVTASIYGAGTGYSAGDIVNVVQTGGSNGQIEVVTADPVTGAVTSIAVSEEGYGYAVTSGAGNGIETGTLNNAGTGYTVGDILAVVQAGGSNGSVKVEVVDGSGVILDLSLETSGSGYAIATGLATTGGSGTGATVDVDSLLGPACATTGAGNNDFVVDIDSITDPTDATTIYFEDPQIFIASQPVEVFDPSGVSRGTGTVATSSNPSSTTMTLTSPGITGAIAGDTVVVDDVTRFAHSESTRVTVIQYNQVRFFRSETPTVPNAVPITTTTTVQNKKTTQTTAETITAPNTTTYTQPDDPSSVITVDFTPPIVFDSATALTALMDIAVNEFYTTYIDTVNSTGYAWFAFYNETTAIYSPISNPIPYSDFPQNTVKKIFETFNSSVNTKELQLITQTDRYNWLNEGMSHMTNELNLTNWEFSASEELELQLKSGISKYLLPQDFSDLLFVTDNDSYKMDPYTVTFQRPINNTKLTYAIRGRFLTFYPTPTTDTTVKLVYLKTAPLFDSLDDIIELPNDSFYALKDYMRFRAYQKLNNPQEANHSFSFFQKQIDNMKINSIKRDNSLDSWSIASSANV